MSVEIMNVLCLYRKMFKESFIDMQKIIGDKIEDVSIDQYIDKFTTLSKDEQLSIMRLFTVIVHKYDIYRPYKRISYEDVMENKELHTSFIICFNYFKA
jgi:hypothetical protein